MADVSSKAVAEYLRSISAALARGDSTEHTHRAALVNLIQQLEKGVVGVNEPKGSQGRHPDVKVLLGETPLGFIETKDVGAKLAEVAESEQLRKYRNNLPNLILTDYLEFRWYQKGNLMFTARLAAETSPGKLRRYDTGEQDLLTLVRNFLRAEVTVTSPKELAQRMATLAQWVRRVIIGAFEAETAGKELHSQLKSFREVLLPDLDVPRFADMYAQTLCYGLFAAKCEPSTPQLIARDNAASYLPKTNPFLRKLLASIMASDLNDKVAGAIDAIAFLLNHADIGAILKDFGKRTRQEDPVVHFYETFLAHYDPKMRKSRGVYYTPEPVVSYIVRSVDWLLKEKFGKKDGLADPSVLVLDPACGTGTFLYQVIKLIEERVKAKGQYGTWSTYVRDSLLPRIFGFELLMAPYAVAHLKLGLLLQETGYDFSGEERLGIFLTNTLEEAAKKSDILFAQYISDEANAATEIKRDKPVMVVLGNPPYSKFSANNGEWICRLTRDYYEIDGEPLGERNPKWLQDDYVKFLRFGQWRVDRTGYGIMALITNHGYLDNPTFRGLRHSILSTFRQLYLYDLHGSSKKRETCPDGSVDENVFDIQQGVAVGIFVRADSGEQVANHGDLFGRRADKYTVLGQTSIADTPWSILRPRPEKYLYIPQNWSGQPEYDAGWPVTRIFPTYASTVTTARNHFSMAFDRETLISRMSDLVNPAYTDDELRQKYALEDVSYWRLADARRGLRGERDLPRFALSYCYRPFDFRFVFYHKAVSERLRPEVMRHMNPRNLAFLTHRPQAPGNFTYAYCTRMIGDQCVAASKSGGGGNSFQFPLYVLSSERGSGLFDEGGESGAAWLRKSNLAFEFTAEMEQKLGLEFVPDGTGDLKATFGPEDVFNYIYAVFHSPTYRKRYAEFLKIDFPRVPLTSDKALFRKLVALGGELVGLHLLESPAVNEFVTKYPKKGADTVERVDFLDDKKRVYINSDQYFEGVKPEWWEFHIGGYQVLQKWLKDRKGRKLAHDDITHYQRVVKAIKETIRLMAEIDKAIPKWPIE
jgi:hypothetical protein